MHHNILLVDDDLGIIQLLAGIVSDLAQLRFATNGEDALRLARELTPDLLVLDAEMPGMSGFQVLQAFKADAALADVPAIFITSHCDADFEVAGFDIGAADFLAKPVSPQLVRARVATQLRLKQLSDALRDGAATDLLTGLANRRSFDIALERAWRSARREGTPLAVLAIDIDHLDRYNLRHGQRGGDECLLAVRRALLGASLRPADLLARRGSDEFALLLPNTPRRGADHVAHRVLDAVNLLAIDHPDAGATAKLSVSIGVGHYDEASPCWTSPAAYSHSPGPAQLACNALDLSLAADKALKRAKQAGRARVRLLDIVDAHKGSPVEAVATLRSPAADPAADSAA
jgi:diguanylate cyclase (GGDEF)-like protein